MLHVRAGMASYVCRMANMAACAGHPLHRVAGPNDPMNMGSLKAELDMPSAGHLRAQYHRPDLDEDMMALGSTPKVSWQPTSACTCRSAFGCVHAPSGNQLIASALQYNSSTMSILH